jgi:hypothetical protein
LALNLRNSAVGPARTAGILEHLLRNDARSEPLGGASQRIAKELVLGMGTHDQQPSAPLFPDEVLCQCIGQHRARWSDMDHVASAIFFAQPIVGRADVEEENTVRPAGVSRFEQRVRREVGEYERNTARRKCHGRRGGIIARREARVLQREPLVQELAGGVIILDRKPRAGQPIVIGRYLNQRETRFRLRRAQITNPDLCSIGKSRCPEEQQSYG